MKKVLTTFATGALHEEMLGVTLPAMARYAREHDYCLYIPPYGEVLDFCGGDPRLSSWSKVAVALALLGKHDFVLWLDADVLPRRFDRDIEEDCGDALSMVVHETPDGRVPNCGVLGIRRSVPAISVLHETLRNFSPGGRWRRSPWWWEQAEIIHQLGGDPNAETIAVPESPKWSMLPYEWNPHIADGRGVPEDCRFFHATQWNDRVAELKRMAAC